MDIFIPYQSQGCVCLSVLHVSIISSKDLDVAKSNFMDTYRVCTDLEKSLNLTLVLESSWNLKKKYLLSWIVLEFCKNHP